MIFDEDSDNDNVNEDTLICSNKKREKKALNKAGTKA